MRKALALVVSILLVIFVVAPASAGQRSARSKPRVCTTAEGVLICGVAAGIVGSCLYDGVNCAAKARSATCSMAEVIAPVREKTIEFTIGVLFPQTVKRTSNSSCQMVVGDGGGGSYGVAQK